LQGVVKNNEDLTKLLEKLQHQLKFVQDKTSSFADPRFRPSGAAVQGLVDSLQKYASCADFSLGISDLSELEDLQEKLESLGHHDESRTKQVLKKIWSVHSDRDDIDGCANRLEGAFQLFMVRNSLRLR
jgi:hypothetical protein